MIIFKQSYQTTEHFYSYVFTKKITEQIAVTAYLFVGHTVAHWNLRHDIDVDQIENAKKILELYANQIQNNFYVYLFD